MQANYYYYYYDHDFQKKLTDIKHGRYNYVLLHMGLFLKRFIAQKVRTVYSRTSYRIVPLTSLNKYLHNDTSETEENIDVTVNNGCEKF